MLLRRLLLSRMLLVEVALQQTRQLLVRHRRRHRSPQRRLRMTIDGVVRVLVVKVVKVPEALPQGAEAADGRQGSRRRRPRQPGRRHGSQPVLGGGGGGEVIARDPRRRGGRQGLVDVEGPETK